MIDESVSSHSRERFSRQSAKYFSVDRELRFFSIVLRMLVKLSECMRLGRWCSGDCVYSEFHNLMIAEEGL